MKNFQLISEINGSPWFLESNWFNQNKALLQNILLGQQANSDFGTPRASDDDFKRPFNPKVVAGTQVVDQYDLRFWENKIAPNSVFELQIEGPIFRSAACAYGTLEFSSWFDLAANNPNIIGAAIKIHSPGGSAWGTQMLVQAIQRFQDKGKPVVAFVNDGLAASAGYWIFSACTEGYIGAQTDALGSIGVYIPFYNYDGWLKKQGIEERFIYAPQSTRKNETTNEAKKNNDAPIKEMLKHMAGTFIDSVASSRNVNPEVFTGALYMGQEAVDMGLADGVISYSEVISRVQELASTGAVKPKNTAQIQSNTMFGNKFKALAALDGKATTAVTAEQLIAINAELNEAGLENVLVVSAADHASAVQALADAQAALSTANDSLTAAQQNVTDLQAQIDALTTERDTLSARNQELEGWAKDAGVDPTAIKTNAPDKVTTAKDEFKPITGFDDDPVSQKIAKNHNL